MRNPTWRTIVLPRRGATAWEFQWYRFWVMIPFRRFGGIRYTSFHWDSENYDE